MSLATSMRKCLRTKSKQVRFRTRLQRGSSPRGEYASQSLKNGVVPSQSLQPQSAVSQVKVSQPSRQFWLACEWVLSYLRSALWRSVRAHTWARGSYRLDTRWELHWRSMLRTKAQALHSCGKAGEATSASRGAKCRLGWVCKTWVWADIWWAGSTDGIGQSTRLLRCMLPLLSWVSGQRVAKAEYPFKLV